MEYARVMAHDGCKEMSMLFGFMKRNMYMLDETY